MNVYEDNKGLYIPIVVKLSSRDEAELVTLAAKYTSDRKDLSKEDRQFLEELARMIDMYLVTEAEE